MVGLEGQTFAGCEVLKKLGQGGMGAVYKARDINLDRMVALKTLSNDLAQDPEFITRFRREASLAAKLDHPNLIRVFSAGEFESLYYITMELVEGESARDRLVRDGKLPLAEVLTIGVFVAEALDHGWQHAKLIHRDIKPANIFLSNTGQVKLGDLGLAKSADENSGLTTTGQAVGTPFYISPEQGLGEKEIDFRSDIYSLGCTLYHLITGEPPYACPSSMAVIHKHIYDPPPGILDKIPDCPMTLAILLAKMMAKQPNARHQSYTELIAEMQRVRYRLLEPVAPVPASKALSAASASRLDQKRQQSHALAYCVIATALITIGAGLWIWEPWKSDIAKPPPSVANSRTETPKPSPSTASSLTQEAATLPAERQVQHVLARLKELTPGLACNETHTIEGGNVTKLSIASTAGFSDISPLQALADLRSLEYTVSAAECPLVDLQPLRNLSLVELKLRHVAINDLTPLVKMPLEILHLDSCSCVEISPLKGMQLKRLSLWSSPVSNLDPLAGMPLEWLNCSGTKVLNLTPLRDAKLIQLFCDNTNVSDLSPLRDMPLRILRCDLETAKQNMAVLQAIATLENINGVPVAEFWKDPKAP